MEVGSLPEISLIWRKDEKQFKTDGTYAHKDSVVLFIEFVCCAADGSWSLYLAEELQHDGEV